MVSTIGEESTDSRQQCLFCAQHSFPHLPDESQRGQNERLDGLTSTGLRG
jgi:hypothetical protein